MEEEGRMDNQIDAMKEEAGGVKSMRGAQPHHCWLCRWRKGATSKEISVTSGSWEQPLADNQKKK